MTDPASIATASGLLALATSPFGGAFVAGVIFGALVGIGMWQKFVVEPAKDHQQRTHEERIASLEKRLAEVQIVADKWNRFMERKAMEALNATYDPSI